MARKRQKHTQESEFDTFDDFDDLYDEDIDLRDLTRDFHSTDWYGNQDTGGNFSARRKIERRRDMKKLYSQLDDWEEFGERADW